MSASPQTLTFAPGTMCDERVWHPVWNELRSEFGLDNIPLETARNRHDIEALFDAAFERRRDANEKLNLIAFSMGGYMAFDYAVRHPERVASLVSICAAPMALSERERKQRAFSITYLQTHGYTGPSPSRLNQMLHPKHHGESPIKDIMLAMDASLGAETLLTQLKETTDRKDLTEQLANIDCPCLVIVGDSDPIVPLEKGQKIVGALPNADLKIVEETGHMVPLEAPLWLASTLKSFYLSTL